MIRTGQEFYEFVVRMDQNGCKKLELPYKISYDELIELKKMKFIKRATLRNGKQSITILEW